MKKRLFSIITALALCLTLLPGTALAADPPSEQFSGLTPGGTYWFDLSGVDIPGTVNEGEDYGGPAVPDKTLRWVPFTYAGTVHAYVLNENSSGVTTASEAAASTTSPDGKYGYTYDHSLFIADYNVTHTVSWDDLNGEGLIFGKSYTSGGVDYTLRAPSAGSNGNASGVTPASNEWDAILDKNSVAIKNYLLMGSWGQDTSSANTSARACRGYNSARYWSCNNVALQNAGVGFRPVLEILNPDTLGSDGLTTVTLDLNGGPIGSITGPVNLAVKSGGTYTAPSSVGLTLPTGNTGTYFKWQDSSGNRYEPGGTVPADVTSLTALWELPELDFTNRTENATGEGYAWDNSTKTLTLTNYNMTEPCNGPSISLPDGAKLVLSGANTLNSKNGALIEVKGALNISGSGSLTGTAGGRAALNAQGDVTITDCTLNLSAISYGSSVINTNANSLTIAGNSDVSLHSPETQSMGWGINTGDGGDFTLESNAKLTISGQTGMLIGTASGRTKIANVKIAGTLETTGCAKRGVNLLGAVLNMEGSTITMKTEDGCGLWLYQPENTLTGQTNIKGFTGRFQVSTGNGTAVDYYKVTKDGTLGLYAKDSTVTFTAETIEGKAFKSWTATGVTLTDSTNATISFTMPGSDVALTTAYKTLVSGVSLDQSELSLTVDGTQTLTATVQPSNAENKKVTWSSSDPAVASVDENGLVTAKKAGTATITVTTEDGGKTASCVVTVSRESSGGGSSSSGGSSTPTYPPTVEQPDEGGTVTVSPKNPEKDDKVTITPNPDEGYEVEQILVTDKNGNPVEVTNNGDGTYSFTQPAGKVNVTVTFMDDNTMLNFFVDVPANAYYYDAVLWAAEKGITSGTSDTTFSPDAVLTRGQTVTFLWRANGSPAVSGGSFGDVAADAYYASAVAWAESEGVTSGTGGNRFSPDADCTRAQIVTFLYRDAQ